MQYLTIYNLLVVFAFNTIWLIMAGSFKEYLCFYSFKEIRWLIIPFYIYAMWGLINLLPLIKNL